MKQQTTTKIPPELLEQLKRDMKCKDIEIAESGPFCKYSLKKKYSNDREDISATILIIRN